jgi:hypothetical protein
MSEFELKFSATDVSIQANVRISVIGQVVGPDIVSPVI